MLDAYPGSAGAMNPAPAWRRCLPKAPQQYRSSGACYCNRCQRKCPPWETAALSTLACFPGLAASGQGHSVRMSQHAVDVMCCSNSSTPPRPHCSHGVLSSWCWRPQPTPARPLQPSSHDHTPDADAVGSHCLQVHAATSTLGILCWAGSAVNMPTVLEVLMRALEAGCLVLAAAAAAATRCGRAMLLPWQEHLHAGQSSETVHLMAAPGAM